MKNSTVGHVPNLYRRSYGRFADACVERRVDRHDRHGGVQVCLQHEDSRDMAAYYYLRHVGVIILNPADEKTKPGETQV